MDLIRRCRAGDEEAFAALFHQYKSLVYRTAYLILESAEEAEDVLQEVFIQLHRSLSTFEPTKGAFTTWLHRVTVNHCLSRRRKHRLLLSSLESLVPLRLGASPSLQDHLEGSTAFVSIPATPPAPLDAGGIRAGRASGAEPASNS